MEKLIRQYRRSDSTMFLFEKKDGSFNYEITAYVQGREEPFFVMKLETIERADHFFEELKEEL